MAIRHQFPLSHVRAIEPLGAYRQLLNKTARPHSVEQVDDDTQIITFISVKDVRPSRWVIRNERGGFNE